MQETSSTSAPLRSTSAARQLFGAMRADLAAIARRLRPSSTSIGFIIKSTLLGTVFLALGLALAMLWALLQVPLEKRPGIDGPSVLIEAATGETLGRVGSLGVALRRG